MQVAGPGPLPTLQLPFSTNPLAEIETPLHPWVGPVTLECTELRNVKPHMCQPEGTAWILGVSSFIFHCFVSLLSCNLSLDKNNPEKNKNQLSN